jgi:hypothetical protein
MATLELCDSDITMLYCLGSDWDGASSRKFELLRANDKYDLIVLVETHLAVVAEHTARG